MFPRWNADKLPMRRRRVVDVAVVLVAAALCCAPFVQAVYAGSMVDVPVTVDQQVREITMISKPDGAFNVDNSGRSTGKIAWDVYTSFGMGFQLSVRTDAVPALRDEKGKATILDYSENLSAWNVSNGERRFGFSVKGAQSLSIYDKGSLYRGFDGDRPIQISRRRGGPIGNTETDLMLSSEFDEPLPSGTSLKLYIAGIATVNL